jgi:hypothetical protein
MKKCEICHQDIALHYFGCRMNKFPIAYAPDHWLSWIDLAFDDFLDVRFLKCSMCNKTFENPKEAKSNPCTQDFDFYYKEKNMVGRPGKRRLFRVILTTVYKKMDKEPIVFIVNNRREGLINCCRVIRSYLITKSHTCIDGRMIFDTWVQLQLLPEDWNTFQFWAGNFDLSADPESILSDRSFIEKFIYREAN